MNVLNHILCLSIFVLAMIPNDIQLADLSVITGKGDRIPITHCLHYEIFGLVKRRKTPHLFRRHIENLPYFIFSLNEPLQLFPFAA